MGANEERAKGKAEEIKGHIKHGVGSAIGNEQMEAEGHADEATGQARQDAAKAAERVKGAGEQLKGKVKGAAGDLLDNEQMQAEGRADDLKGQARQKANQ
jgi:uncharacterized protein YjbJ (UPF0337 family)